MLAHTQMTQGTDRMPARSHRGAPLALVMLVLPIGASADSKYQDALLLQGPARAKDTWVGEGTPTGVKSENWVFVFKVGEYTYTANVNRVGGVFARKDPKVDDWPQNSTIQARFHRRMGSLLVDLKGPNKEEEDAWVFSKKGADGRELCGKIKCEATPEDAED